MQSIARALLTLAATSTLAASNVDRPDEYAITAHVVPAGTAPVQRIELPAAILAALRRADGADMRLFDRDGRILPMARGAPGGGPTVRRDVPVLPIRGSADDLNVAGVSLTLDGEGRARVVGVGGPSVRAEAVTVGALLDTRSLTGSGRTLELAVELPPGQPVTLAVDASADLKSWRPVAEQVAYQSSEVPIRLSIPLVALSLDRSWLRVSWSASSRLLTPVSVRAATVVASGERALAPTIAATVTLSADRHRIGAALPFATPLTGLAVEPVEDAILPFHVLGRADDEQPWRVVGAGTAARVAGQVRGDLVPVQGTGVRRLRIEADARTDGFATAPALTLRFAPATIVFATGPGPLTLAAGKADADDRFLPLTSVLRTGDQVDTLPVATLTLADRQPLRLMPDAVGINTRRWLLWGVLLLATACLAWVAWQLTRKRRLPEAPGAAID